MGWGGVARSIFRINNFYFESKGFLEKLFVMSAEPTTLIQNLPFTRLTGEQSIRDLSDYKRNAILGSTSEVGYDDPEFDTSGLGLNFRQGQLLTLT
jgi:hypothetical protein